MNTTPQLRITISGPAGSGKTSLLRLIAYALQQRGVTVDCIDDGCRVKCDPLFLEWPMTDCRVVLLTEIPAPNGVAAINTKGKADSQTACKVAEESRPYVPILLGHDHTAAIGMVESYGKSLVVTFAADAGITKKMLSNIFVWWPADVPTNGVAPDVRPSELNSPESIDRYARSLAMGIWRDHYIQTSPEFELLDSTYGVMSQIDNMLTGLARKGSTQPVSAQGVSEPVKITPEEMGALKRFEETTLDGEGYDVPKLMMTRLAEIGLIRRASGSYYMFTDFGRAMLSALQSQPPQALSDEKIIERAFNQFGIVADDADIIAFARSIQKGQP